MATTSYVYRDDESLGDIATKFNTTVLNLVKLNKWLKDPNDGHTYMFPNKAPNYIKPHYDGLGNIDYYELSDYQEDEEYIKYRYIELVIPLVGNGNTSIEDYWNTANDITGISYNILVNNLINDTNIITPALYDESGNIVNDTGEAILPGNAHFRLNSANYGLMSQMSNAYLSDYVGKLNTITDREVEVANQPESDDTNSSQVRLSKLATRNNSSLKSSNNNKAKAKKSSGKVVVDYAGSVLGNYVQSMINAGGNNSKNTNANSFRGLSKTYTYDTVRYKSIGNPIRGVSCTIIVGTKTLNMPCYPESIQDSTAINYSSQNVLGRSEPFQMYNNSGPRTIQFTFELHREMFGSSASDRNKIETIVKYVEASAYPNYDGSVSAVKTQVTVGKNIYISGIITNQSTTWHGPIGQDDKYNQVTLTFTVTEVTGNPKSFSYIKSHGGYRK